MTAPATLLPAPPTGERYWSIVTLAGLLCVAPAAVDAQLAPAEDGGSDESPDFRGPRLHVAYDVDTPTGPESFGDVYLTDEAADRIAAALPAGLLARRITAGHPAGTALLGPDHIWDLARHIVEHLGGER